MCRNSVAGRHGKHALKTVSSEVPLYLDDIWGLAIWRALVVSRPAISGKRLPLTPNGNIRYQLKTPYRDDTTHVIFEPPDFIARLAALVPKPRVKLTRFHGIFAPNRSAA